MYSKLVINTKLIQGRDLVMQNSNNDWFTKHDPALNHSFKWLSKFTSLCQRMSQGVCNYENLHSIYSYSEAEL